MAAVGLRYGAFDFRVDPDGAPWFLECNPEGQYLWIEIETGGSRSPAPSRSRSPGGTRALAGEGQHAADRGKGG